LSSEAELSSLHIAMQKQQAVCRVRAKVRSPFFQQAAGSAKHALAGRWRRWYAEDTTSESPNLGLLA